LQRLEALSGHACARKKEILLQLQIPSIICGGGANRVNKAVHSGDPKADVHANPVTRKVTIASPEAENWFVSVLADTGRPLSGCLRCS